MFMEMESGHGSTSNITEELNGFSNDSVLEINAQEKENTGGSIEDRRKNYFNSCFGIWSDGTDTDVLKRERERENQEPV